MNSTKLLLYSRRLHKWRCHRETKRLRKSSGWNRLRRGYGGSSALLEYAVMHGDEAEAVGRATPSRWSRTRRVCFGGMRCDGEKDGSDPILTRRHFAERLDGTGKM